MNSIENIQPRELESPADPNTPNQIYGTSAKASTPVNPTPTSRAARTGRCPPGGQADGCGLGPQPAVREPQREEPRSPEPLPLAGSESSRWPDRADIQRAGPEVRLSGAAVWVGDPAQGRALHGLDGRRERNRRADLHEERAPRLALGGHREPPPALDPGSAFRPRIAIALERLEARHPQLGELLHQPVGAPVLGSAAPEDEAARSLDVLDRHDLGAH